MKIIFILLLGLCILWYFNTNENFDDTFIAKYKQAATIYNGFMQNYIQATTTSWGLAQPAPQASTAQTGAAQQPTNDQLNQYIPTLNKSFPLITAILPDAQTMDDIIKIQSQLPKSATPYQSALEWMNENLVKAQSSLQDSLKKITGFTNYMGTNEYDSFEDICKQIQSCQQSNAAAQSIDIIQTYGPVFDALIALQPLLDKNNQLIAKSKAIQDQAQSGSLLGTKTLRVSPYTIPPTKVLSPDQEKDYKANYAQYYAMKKHNDQINANLR